MRSTSYRRPQPIRDAILAFLTEPRSARAVADHIDRPVPTATGHLAAMRRRGLVLRLGFSAYARADYAGPPIAFRSCRKPKTGPDDRVEKPVEDMPPFAEPSGNFPEAGRFGA